MEQKSVCKILQIEGMTCTGCEIRIESALKKLDGVIEAKAIYSSSNVYVTYNIDIVRLDNIIEAVEKLDYRVRNRASNQGVANVKPQKTTSGDKVSINQLLGIGIIIFALYVIIKNSVGFNFIPQVNQNMGYGILFVVGLITSIHCITMCGGINLSQSVSYKFKEDDKSRVSKLKPSLMYNTGRIISYTVMGGIVGALGSVISFSGAAKGIVAIISGVFMVIAGLNMLNIFPWLRKLNPRILKIFGNKIHSSNGKNSPFYIGLLNGLMPCGPLQAMQIYALGTGGFFTGALSMFIFSLGTVPLMFGFGTVSSFLSGKYTQKMMKASAVLVMVLGLIMINRGFGLSGTNIFYSSPTAPENIAKIKGDVQVVVTKLEHARYAPIVVQKGIPVKWTIKADSKNLNGCNNTMIISIYNIQKKLVSGDNLIEFIPGKEGNIIYTCWMGMIKSNIKVVSDITKVSDEDIQKSGGSSNPGTKAAAAED